MNILANIIIIICVLGVFIACAPKVPYRTLKDFQKAGDIPSFQKMDNPWAVDVTFEQLWSVLLEVPQKYDFKIIPGNCGLYAEATHNELELRGVRAALVFAKIGENYFHAFTAFNTTDRGRIYVDLTDGILVIAEKTDGKYKFVKQLTNQIQVQEIGYEKDFYIFW